MDLSRIAETEARAIGCLFVVSFGIGLITGLVAGSVTVWFWMR